MESLIGNLPAGQSESFILNLLLLSKKFNFILILVLVIAGFLLANLINFALGFSFAFFGNKFFHWEIREKQLKFARFLVRFQFLIIIVLGIIFRYGYFGQIFVIFLGYSWWIILRQSWISLRNILLNILGFAFVLICVKLINIFLIYYKLWF